MRVAGGTTTQPRDAPYPHHHASPHPSSSSSSLSQTLPGLSQAPGISQASSFGLPPSSSSPLPRLSSVLHPPWPVFSLPGDCERTPERAAAVEGLPVECPHQGSLVSQSDGDASASRGVRQVRVERHPSVAASLCERPTPLHGGLFTKGFRGSDPWCVSADTLFPECVEDVCDDKRPRDVVPSSPDNKSPSSWSLLSDPRDRLPWDQPHCGSGSQSSTGQRQQSQRSAKVRGQRGGARGRQGGGMSVRVVSIRGCRQWLGVGVPLALFLYVVLCCNSALWSSMSLQPATLPLTLPGSGFRKLLEEQERGRLSLNQTLAGRTQRLPSCIIIGVRKCGTRALLEFLDLHPDIVTAEDEMHFFNDDDRYRLGLDWYRHLMPPSLPHQVTMEKTPGYFISPITPRRVHRMNSSVKLIVLLRHPTTRTISDYTQIFYNKMLKNESLATFENIVIDRDTGGVNTRYKAVQISMYHHHFRHWTDVFPLRQIHLVDGDRLITDPVSEIRDIEKFLGLEHRIDYNLLYYNSTRGFYCMHVNATHEKCLGASKGRKHPEIQVPVIRKLNKFFQPHNQELFDLIDRKFPWS